MNKQELRAKIVEVVGMDRSDLENFKKQVGLSDISGKEKYFLMEAIDLRDEDLGHTEEAIVVLSELNMGEVE